MMPMPRTSMWLRVSSALVHNHFAAVHQRDLDHVVGHEAVAALDEGQDGLAFADAAFAADDDAHAEDVHHAAHFGAARREHHFQRQRGQLMNFIVTSGRLENRHVRVCSAAVRNSLSGLQTAAEDDARDFVGEQIGVTRLALLWSRATQIIHLRVAHDLHAFVGEILREAAQRQAGAVDGRLADDALEIRSRRRRSFICSAAACSL